MCWCEGSVGGVHMCWDVRGGCLLEKGECVIAMQSKLGCHPHLASLLVLIEEVI